MRSSDFIGLDFFRGSTRTTKTKVRNLISRFLDKSEKISSREKSKSLSIREIKFPRNFQKYQPQFVFLSF